MKPAHGLLQLPDYLPLSATLCLLLFSGQVAAQYRVTRITTGDGLSSDIVSGILQDHVGFMWFGTKDGLNRYDGHNMKVFRHDAENPNSLCHDYIFTLMEDGRGMLWVGTRDGLSRYNPALGTFTTWRHDPNNPNSLSDNRINCLADEVGTDAVWIGTPNGLNRLDTKTGECRRYFHDTNGGNRETNAISNMMIAGDYLWSAMRGGLAAMRLDQPGEPAFFKDISVTAMTGDKNGNIWLAGKDGLARIRPESPENIEIIPSSVPEAFAAARGLAMDLHGSLWVSSFGLEGLLRLKPETGRVDHRRGDEGLVELAENQIWTLYTGRSGDLWVGTFGGGVNRLSLNPFTSFHRIEGNVASLARGTGDGFWVGKQGSGLEYVDSELSAQTPVPELSGFSEETVTTLLKDGAGELWIGTQTGGLSRYNPTTGKIQNYRHNEEDPDSLGWDLVISLFEDARGELWIGTLQGVSRMNATRENRFINYLQDSDDPLSFGDTTVLCIRGDPDNPDGSVWFGTTNAGLNRMVLDLPGIFEVVSADPKDPWAIGKNPIFTLWEDTRKRRIWAGTAGGLKCVDTTTGLPIPFSAREGLPVINHIQGDSRGRLWLGTSEGLYLFDPATDSWGFYDRDNGLPFDKFSTNCGFRGPLGRLYFGGEGGVLDFNPDDITLKRNKTRTVLTRLTLDGIPVEPKHSDPDSPLVGPVAYTKDLTISYDNRTMELEFAGLDFSAPVRQRYQYRLDDFNDDWRETDADNRRAVYTSLDPGRYTFRVRSGDGGGSWGEETMLRIKVPTPPWKSWWAITLYIGALIAMAGWYLRRQEHKLERERRLNERLRQVDKLKDEFLANTSHELRTPLHGMVGLAESLIEGVTGDLPETTRHNLGMIISSGRRLSSLVNDILDFSKLKNRGLELQRKAVDIHGVVDLVLVLNEPAAGAGGLELVNAVPEDFPNLYADEDRIQQILHNLVGNAIKFTDSGRVTVSAEKKGKQGVIHVTDTGRGISKADIDRIFLSFEQLEESETRTQGGTGLGLAICRQLIELHGGKIRVTSKPGEGSTFTFQVPLYQGEEQQVHTTLPEPLNTLKDHHQAFMADEVAQADMGDGAHILVVDDEPINRQVLHNHLALANYRTTEAADGKEALALLEQETFDLVLLDVMMPGWSGYEVCRRIRERFPVHELPVLFLTARTQTDDLVNGYKSGANDYLPKPISARELRHRVGLQLRILQATRDLAAKSELVRRKERQKMDALKTLTSGIAHEINNAANAAGGGLINLLNGLREFREFLLLLAGEDADQEILETIEERITPLLTLGGTVGEAVDRARGVVIELYRFSQLHQAERRRVALIENLESALSLLRPLFAEDVEFQRDYTDPLEMECQPAELSLVFYHLICNACEAVQTRREKNDAPGVVLVTTYREHENAVVSIQDNGAGMDENTRERIFDPFFTTKPVGKGTGLGMSTSLGIVERHQGRMEVESSPDKGTVVSIYLPREPAGTGETPN
ncbi:MAG: ATP-binding protein [Acidobacteriota bacterium]|nr:ATP-binding protein [Acidobacteriota bacterium]